MNIHFIDKRIVYQTKWHSLDTGVQKTNRYQHWLNLVFPFKYWLVCKLLRLIKINREKRPTPDKFIGVFIPICLSLSTPIDV